MVVIAAEVDGPSPSQQCEIRHRLVAPHGPAAEGRDGHPDEARDHLPHVMMVYAERCQPIGWFAFQDDVRALSKGGEHRTPFDAVEIDDNSPLARVVVPPPKTPFGIRHVIDKGFIRPTDMASRRFHEHHIRPEVGEQLASEGGILAGQFHNADAGQRTVQARHSNHTLGLQRTTLVGVKTE